MKQSMRVKVLKSFPDPHTNRMAEVGREMNVSQNIFWLKRLESKDCELIESKAKSKPANPKADKKGSK